MPGVLVADILPTPQHCRFTPDSFRLKPTTRIRHPVGAPPADVRTARLLAGMFKQHVGVRLQVRSATRYVHSHVLYVGHEGKFEVPLDFAPPHHEGYALRVARDGVLVSATDSAGLFYGVQTLGQVLRLRRRGGTAIPGLEIRDWPALRHRAVMMDIARQVERADYLEAFVRQMAALKKNMFVLYFEDKFRWRKHKALSHPLGYTPQEFRHLAEVAERNHVEFVPAPASLGHCEGILQHDQIAHLREDGAIYQLSLRHRGTRKLLAELYEEILPLYRGRFFHVNCDESPLLAGPPGSPRSYLAESVRLFGEHLLFLHDLLARAGKQMMVWGDMLLHHRRIMKDLPRDIIVVDWDYGSMANRRREALQVFREQGFSVMVAPAACRSAEVTFPQLMLMADNVPHFIRQGVGAGAIGEMTTMWEMRSTNPIVGWPGVVAGAQYAWNPEAIDPNRIARRVAANLHGPEAATAVTRAYRNLSSDLFLERYQEEASEPPIPGTRTYHLDSHEFASTDAAVYLTYRKNRWADRVVAQAARGIQSAAAARRLARWGADDLEAYQLAGMHQALHGQRRQVVNQAGLLVVRAERLRRKGSRANLKRAGALVGQAAADLRELADFAAALAVGTRGVWRRTRHGDDPALEEIYLRRLRFTERGAKRSAAGLHRAACALKEGRDVDLGGIIGGRAALVFEASNPSRTLIDILTPEISVSADGREWRTVNTKGWFFLQRQRYLTALMLPGGRLPRFIRIRTRRTHINPRSFPLAERYRVSTARTLTPGEIIDGPPRADVETLDWRLVRTPKLSYELQAAEPWLLEYELSECP